MWNVVCSGFKVFQLSYLKFMLYQLSFLALTQHVGNQNVLKYTFYAGVVLIAAFYDFLQFSSISTIK